MNYQTLTYSQQYLTNFRITAIIILGAISTLLFANSPVYAEGLTEANLRDAIEQSSSIDGTPSVELELSELESYTIVVGLDDEEFQRLIEPLGEVEWHKVELSTGTAESQTAIVIYAYRVNNPDGPN